MLTFDIHAFIIKSTKYINNNIVDFSLNSKEYLKMSFIYDFMKLLTGYIYNLI